MTFLDILETIDGWVWGPVMLVILVGTGIFLTVRTKFLPWRNLGYAIKSTLSKEARTTHRGTGDVSPSPACVRRWPPPSEPATLPVWPPRWPSAVPARWCGCGSPPPSASPANSRSVLWP